MILLLTLKTQRQTCFQNGKSQFFRPRLPAAYLALSPLFTALSKKRMLGFSFLLKLMLHWTDRCWFPGIMHCLCRRKHKLNHLIQVVHVNTTEVSVFFLDSDQLATLLEKKGSVLFDIQSMAHKMSQEKPPVWRFRPNFQKKKIPVTKVSRLGFVSSPLSMSSSSRIK